MITDKVKQEIIFTGRYISLKYRIYKYTNYEIKQI